MNRTQIHNQVVALIKSGVSPELAQATVLQKARRLKGAKAMLEKKLKNQSIEHAPAHTPAPTHAPADAPVKGKPSKKSGKSKSKGTPRTHLKKSTDEKDSGTHEAGTD